MAQGDPGDRRAINSVPPPWAQTLANTSQGVASGAGLVGEPIFHPTIQHPNPTHVVGGQVVPFPGGIGYQNFVAGRAKHEPQFSAPRGLFRGTRR